MTVHNIDSHDEFKKAIANNPIVVLYAFATWCGPCRLITPKVAWFSEQFKTVYFAKFDVDVTEDVATELGIRAMPTFVIFKNGEKVAEVIGANPAALQQAIIKQLD